MLLQYRPPTRNTGAGAVAPDVRKSQLVSGTSHKAQRQEPYGYGKERQVFDLHRGNESEQGPSAQDSDAEDRSNRHRGRLVQKVSAAQAQEHERADGVDQRELPSAGEALTVRGALPLLVYC